MSYRKLPAEMQRKAEEELNEVSSRIPSDIMHMKEWLAKQPHLNARNEDQWILNFLRGSKFSLERAKERLDLYYTSRTISPDFYGNRDPFSSEIQNLLNKKQVIISMDTSKPTLPVLVMFRCDRVTPDTTRAVTFIKLVLMMSDIAMHEQDNIIVNGVNIVIDFKGADYGFIGQVSLNLLKQLSMTVEDVYPIRTKSAYGFNFLPILEILYNMLTHVFSKKFGERLMVHTNDGLEHLRSSIPPSVLPSDYGGTAGTFDEIAEEWKAKLESYDDWFRDDRQYCSDETKRPGKPRNSSDVFGVDGSFRKLGFD